MLENSFVGLSNGNWIVDCRRLEAYSSRVQGDRNCSGDSESQLVLRSGQRRDATWRIFVTYTVPRSAPVSLPPERSPTQPPPFRSTVLPVAILSNSFKRILFDFQELRRSSLLWNINLPVSTIPVSIVPCFY